MGMNVGGSTKGRAGDVFLRTGMLTRILYRLDKNLHEVGP